MNHSPGDIVNIILDPTKGSEQKGMRPCIVVSPKSLNKNLKICTVIPMTTAKKKWPTRVETIGKGTEGQAAIEQIRTISQSRISKKVGKVEGATLNEIRLVIRQTYTED